MATSLLLWNSSKENSGGGGEERETKVSQEQETKPENAKQRGRKSGKSSGSSQKKQPQRGLGVAQLERLRLQERWKKKITDIEQVKPQSFHDHQFPFQFPFPFADQQSGVSVPVPRFCPLNIGALGDGQSNSQNGYVLHPYRFGNGGFSGGAGCSGVRTMFHDQFQPDRQRLAAPEATFQSGNVFESGKELSSIQTMHCRTDEREICVKKKRINGGGNLGFYVGTGKYPEISPIGGFDFLGLNLGSNNVINGERSDFAARGESSLARCSRPNVREEVEVVAIHRKGKSMGGSVLMEYEFFPRKDGRSFTNNNNGGCSSNTDSSPTEVTAVVAGEASLTTNTTNFLDLSLKLSC